MLFAETWRAAEEEIWETEQGHKIMCARNYGNKHGVAIVVNRK